ncbi:MAG: ABC transporter ATP-binding protein [Burkholderiaceae bacterium]
MTSSPTILEINHLHVAAVKRQRLRRRFTMLLRDVSLAVQAGEVRALVGESGAGKSMIVRTLLDVTPPGVSVLSGHIGLLGLDWLNTGAAERRAHLGKDIALVPQDPLTALNPVLRIGRQMGDLLAQHLRLDREARHALMLQWLEAVQIREPARVLQQYPHELSGGMRQRVLIAMAFSCEPKLILADEPTTALDVTVQREVLVLLRQLQREHKTAILFITHNLGIVAKLCDSATVLHSGMVLEQGNVSDIFANANRHKAAPYTEALLAATPRYDRPGETLKPVANKVTEALQARAAAFDQQYATDHGLRLARPAQ